MKVIDEALRETGMTAAAASTEAVGNPSFIKNIRAGSSPSVDNLEKLANVLGLELYFGFPKESSTGADDSWTVLRAVSRRLRLRPSASPAEVIYAVDELASRPSKGAVLARLLVAVDSAFGETSGGHSNSEEEIARALEIIRQIRRDSDRGGRTLNVEELLQRVLEEEKEGQRA